MASSLEKWQAITQKPQVVQFFQGLFERLGVRVTDTGESFTCIHLGDRIAFEPEVDASKVDYTVEINASQVDRLAAQAAAGSLDRAEQYRVISTLFTPATAATLRNPILSNNILRILAGAENLIHVELKSPVPDENDYRHTLIYINGQWVVIPGLHGKPRRRYAITMEHALDYQRHIFSIVRCKSLKEWIRFSGWYREWRKGVSAPVEE